MSAARMAPPLAWAAFVAALVLFGLMARLVAEGAAVTYLGSVWADLGITASFVGFAGLGAVVTQRQPGNGVGWILTAVGLPMVAVMALVRYALNAMSADGAVLAPWIPWLAGWMWLPSIILLATALPLLVPDGQLPSPRWRPFLRTIPVVIAGFVAAYALRPGPLESPFDRMANPLWPSVTVDPFPWFPAASGIIQLGLIAAGFAGLRARFRRSHGIERQQIKWFLYGVSVTVVALAMGTVTQIALGYQAAREVTGVIVSAGFAATLFGAAIAILKYRLYDIDVLINRTLVYGVLSAGLGTTYVASIVLAQALLRPLTGGSELAVAVSTLATLAVVQPLRRRIQDGVDRRFYRSRYDAARTLDAFSARLRDEVDIDSVRADLLVVVGETIRPAHASVWLRERR